ncbi:MAG TPA: LamG-like jellyroll fold domain-containing protein, partial [Candidatus Acidoferrum sp.]|nr:LamG-like jellyroll fold domain-containing protein [Candidatus Acidoferrum sp.]
DVVRPTVIAVNAERTARNLTNVTVKFSEPVDLGSAEDPGNYVLDENILITYGAVLQPDLTTVLLTVDPLTPGATHTLTIFGVSDRAGSANEMIETNWTFTGPPTLVPPIIATRFEEGSGTTTTNSGTLGGSATLVQQNSFPTFSANIPTGAFAPAGNLTSIDLGNISAGDGARAIDLTTAAGPGGTVGALNAFTVCGWVNARDLNEGYGGNRVAFALASGNGPGFDIVQLNNGALRIGVNQWPDGDGGGGPFSSAGKITADLQAGAANWVFFAVTYDPAAIGGEINYYFGKPDQEAALDVAAPYARGPVLTSGTLSLGNFSTVDVGARTSLGPDGPSRVFRGLMDELQVFDDALALEQIRLVQLNSGLAPSLAAVRENNQIAISWDAPGAFQLLYRDVVNQGIWQTNTTAPETNGTRRTVRLPTTGNARFFRLQGQ